MTPAKELMHTFLWRGQFSGANRRNITRLPSKKVDPETAEQLPEKDCH
jgi:hypothetical protein